MSPSHTRHRPFLSDFVLLLSFHFSLPSIVSTPYDSTLSYFRLRLFYYHHLRHLSQRSYSRKLLDTHMNPSSELLSKSHSTSNLHILFSSCDQLKSSLEGRDQSHSGRQRSLPKYFQLFHPSFPDKYLLFTLCTLRCVSRHFSVDFILSCVHHRHTCCPFMSRIPIRECR